MLTREQYIAIDRAALSNVNLPGGRGSIEKFICRRAELRDRVLAMEKRLRRSKTPMAVLQRDFIAWFLAEMDRELDVCGYEAFHSRLETNIPLREVWERWERKVNLLRRERRWTQRARRWFLYRWWGLRKSWVRLLNWG